MAERLAVLNAERHRAKQAFSCAKLDSRAPLGSDTFENVSGHSQGNGATMELLGINANAKTAGKNVEHGGEVDI